MKPQERWKIINDNMRLYKDPTQIWQQNVVNLNTGSTLEHELLKTEIAYKLIQQGSRIVCEAKLRNGMRPDILVIDVNPPIAYEILNSESDTQLEHKRKRYEPIRIIPIRCKHI